MFFFHFPDVCVILFRYGKIVSTKAILDKTTNKCKGMYMPLYYIHLKVLTDFIKYANVVF